MFLYTRSRDTAYIKILVQNLLHGAAVVVVVCSEGVDIVVVDAGCCGGAVVAGAVTKAVVVLGTVRSVSQFLP